MALVESTKFSPLEAIDYASPESVPVMSPDEARAHLPAYNVHVVDRQPVGDGEKQFLPDVGTFWREKVLLSDGAVRDVTISEPDTNLHGIEGTSPYPISATDALGTGPHGINRLIQRELTAEGFPVVWFHHQGRDGKLRDMPRFLLTKSLGRSAHHQHALFDDLSGNAGFETDVILGAGDSRGYMIGEPVEAIAPDYDRTVAYGDYIAGCFEHAPSPKELLEIVKGVPKELLSLGRIASNAFKEALREGDPALAFDLLGTLDFHPKNSAHEKAWIIPLMRGELGKYLAAVPNDAKGARTLLEDDAMSQPEAMMQAHAHRPGIKFFVVKHDVMPHMSHLDLVNQEVQGQRKARFGRLLVEMQQNNFVLANVDFDHVIGSPYQQ